MFSSLIPAFRELRAPLAAGFLWLFTFYLAVAQRIPRLTETRGVAHDVAVLVTALGPAETIAATTFVAYLVGILWEAVTAPLVRRFIYPDLTFSSNIMVDGHQIFRDPPPVPILRQAILERLVRRFETDKVAASALAARVDYLQEAFERRGREGEGKSSLGTSGAEVLDAIARRAHDPYAVLIRYLVDVYSYESACRRELPQIPPRLLGVESEVWNVWDRLRAESDFRIAIAGPLAALAVVLSVRSSHYWLFFLGVAILLAYLGRKKGWEAGAMLAEVVGAGRVKCAALVVIDKGPLRWVTDFTWGGHLKREDAVKIPHDIGDAKS
jgi:hypothetical protein